MNLKKAMLIGGVAVTGAGLLCAGAGVAGAALVVQGLRGRKRARLAGKVVAITGASRGLGLALAEEFGRCGAKLVLIARDQWELDRARESLKTRAPGSEVLVIPADLRHAEEAQQAMETATQAFGRVDVLVNNAGVITVGPVESQRIEDFHGVMESNFFTGVHCAMSVLPQMLERRDGMIVNIASIGGKIPVPHLLPYTASKFAAVGFSEGLHAELRSKGVHVLTVCPGLMRTGSHRSALFSGDGEREYQWFSFLANVPGVSASAASAARRIVRAVVARETEIAITPHAAVAARLASVAPEAVALGMSVVNRLLPESLATTGEPKAGADLRTRDTLPGAAIGIAAAKKYNQTA